MKTDETKIQQGNAGEETQVYGNEGNKKVADENTAVPGGKKSTWKQVVIGGVSGVFLGAAGTLFTSSASANDIEEITGNNGNHSEGGTSAGTPISPETAATSDGLPVATVNDDMSFGEAFAAAREQVGAGGVFEWRGGIYGTYYADEWNNMTAEERAEFGSHINYGGGTAAHTAEAEPEVQVAPEVNVHGNESPDVVVVEPEPQPVDNEVQILGVETVDVGDGANVTMGYAEVNGEEVFVVDVDQDGEFDRVFVDANHDGELTSDEVVNIEGQGLMVSDWEQQAQMHNPNDVYLADNNMPDYTNDADVNSFA